MWTFQNASRISRFKGGAVSRIEASGAFATAIVAASKTLLVSSALLALPRVGAAFSERFRGRFAWKAPLAASVVLLLLAALSVRFAVPLVLRERTALGLTLAEVLLLARLVARRAFVWGAREPHADPFI